MIKKKVQILKDDPIGLKKGQEKTLAPEVADELIKEKKAKLIKEVIIVNRKNQTAIVSDLLEKVAILEERVTNLEKAKK